VRIRGCCPKEQTQVRLAEFFVGGVTAKRSGWPGLTERRPPISFIGSVRLSPGNWKIARRLKGSSRSLGRTQGLANPI
jgi:hypothetical protein